MTSKTILDLTAEEARKYFMESRNYGSIDLPKYFDFSDILSISGQHAEAALRTKNLLKQATEREKVNYTLVHNKDGAYAWRPLQLIHPLLYAVLVWEMTHPKHWKTLRDRFGKFGTLLHVECASLPVVTEEDNYRHAEEILNWWNCFEQRSLELALQYSRMVVSDIIDCYGSMYTHAIPRALHGKRESQKDRTENLLGNAIDNRIRAMHLGQTIGIPQGAVLMDFIAELVLGYADRLVAKQLTEQTIDDYHILRYRDDYRIFVNDSRVGETILKVLATTLMELGMRLNPSKTKTSDDIIRDAVKADKIAWLSLGNEFHHLSFEKKLLLLYNHASKFPNCGSMIQPLNEMHRQVHEHGFDGNGAQMAASIAIVTELAYRHPRAYPICMAIVAELMKGQDAGTRYATAYAIMKKFDRLPNTGLLQVWLQRITHPCGEKLDFPEKLCQRVMDPAQPLWENGWLDSVPDIKASLESVDIIDRNELANLSPTMSIEEVQILRARSETLYQG